MKTDHSTQPVVSRKEKESAILRKGEDILEYMRIQSKTEGQRIRLRDLFSSYARLVGADLKAGKAKPISQVVAEKETLNKVNNPLLSLPFGSDGSFVCIQLL